MDRLECLPYTFRKLTSLKALWLSENQVTCACNEVYAYLYKCHKVSPSGSSQRHWDTLKVEVMKCPRVLAVLLQFRSFHLLKWNKPHTEKSILVRLMGTGTVVLLDFGHNWLKNETWKLIKNMQRSFSNSLIPVIHDEKTREIITVKEVWICDPNYHKILWNFALKFSKNYPCFERLYQTLPSWLKNSAPPRFFNPFLSV